MNIEEHLYQLMSVPEYAIKYYTISNTTIRLLVSKRTPAQNDIPTTMFGRNVLIREMLPTFMSGNRTEE